MYYDITCVRFAQRTEQNCSPAVTREYETGLLFEYNYKRRLIRSPYRVTTVGRRFYLSDPYGNEIDFGAEETSFTYNEILELIDQCSCCTPFMFVHSDEIENNGDGTYSIPKILAPDEGDVVFDESLNLYEYKNGTWVIHPQTANNYDGVYNIDSIDVTDNGDGTYTITDIVDPDLGEMAITEDLTFYEFDGANWVLKFAGLDDFISSATDNGDDTYTFTSFDGNTNFTITIPILSVEAGPGVDVDVTDPKRPQVGLNQAAQDSLDLADSAVQPGDLADVATSGDYDDLQNKPPIPNSLDDLSGTSDNITEGSTQLFFTLTERNKLSGIAPGAEVNVNADWNAVSGDAEILNKPTLGTAAAADTGDFATAAQGSKADTAVQPGDLSTVATSGEFGDLQNIPDFIEESQRDQPGGFAGVGMDGFIPSLLLPSYVDDVLEFADFASLPTTGESGKIYVTLDDNLTYRWSGSAYVEISPSIALGETSSTAYRGDRGKTAYDHSQVTSGNPHNVTASDVGLGNVDNTSDADKPVSTAQQAAINQAESNANQYTDDEIANLPCSVQTYPTFGDLPADGKECVLYIADGKYWQWGEHYCDYQNPAIIFEPYFNSFEELPNPGDPSFTYVVDLGGNNLELYIWIDDAYKPVYFDGAGNLPAEWTEGQYVFVTPGNIVVGCRWKDISPTIIPENLFTEDLSLQEDRSHQLGQYDFILNTRRLVTSFPPHRISVVDVKTGKGQWELTQIIQDLDDVPLAQISVGTMAAGAFQIQAKDVINPGTSTSYSAGYSGISMQSAHGSDVAMVAVVGGKVRILRPGASPGMFLKLIDSSTGQVEYQFIDFNDLENVPDFVKTVTGTGVDNTDPKNPVVNPVNLFTDDLTLTEDRSHDTGQNQFRMTGSGSEGEIAFVVSESEMRESLIQVGYRRAQLSVVDYSTGTDVGFDANSTLGTPRLRLFTGQDYYDVSIASKINTFLTLVNVDGRSEYHPLTLPEYADDNAADADINLASGAPYTTQDSRQVKTKSSASPFNPSYGYQTLTDAANISWDMDLGEMAEVTLGGNRTLSNPTNLKRGTYTLLVKQDGTGGRELSFDSAFKWSAGIPPTLTSTANGVDLLTFVSDGTNLYGAITQNYS